MAVVLVFNQRVLHEASQQSQQWICGILRHFQVFFWRRVFSHLRSESRPAHQQVTQTIGQPIS